MAITIKSFKWILIILIWLLCNTTFIANNEDSSQTLLIGNRIGCDQEGQIVEIPFIRMTDPCIVCMCRNSVIDCYRYDRNSTVCTSSKLPLANNDDKDCYHYTQQIKPNPESNRTEDVCCARKRCLTCRIGDRIIANGQTVQDHHICQSHHCHSGTLTSSKMECYVPCDRPIRFLGQCCPSCNACPRNVPDGNEVDPLLKGNQYDPCVRCYCFKGQMICHRRVCPVLPCPRSEWIKKSECCPICRSSKSTQVIQLFNSSCIMGEKRYEHLQSFSYDSCTDCVCKNGTNICNRRSCSTNDETVTKMEEKIAKENSNQSIRCMDTMNENISCTTQSSLVNLICPNGQNIKVKRNGEKTCVPNNDEDGHCYVNDLWNNITTLDGYNYRLNSHDRKMRDGRLCNRILAKDSNGRRFSLHLLHRYLRHSKQHNESAKYLGASLLLWIENTRILLSHRETVNRVRVNRKPAQLPYIHMGQFSIVKDKENNGIRLHALIGIDLWWQPNRSIEIHLKNHFQKHIFGLCGDFNGDPTNDKQQAKDIAYGCQRKPMKSLKSHHHQDEYLFEHNCRPERRDSVRKFCDRIIRRYHQQLLCRPKELRKTYEQCLQNVCHCYGGHHGDDRQCLCYAMQYFLDSCHSETSDIINNRTLSKSELRIPMCKPLKCPPGSEFNFCGNECRKKTCSQQFEQKVIMNPLLNCNECIPGCECIGNRRWHNGFCIPEMMCPLNVHQ